MTESGRRSEEIDLGIPCLSLIHDFHRSVGTSCPHSEIQASCLAEKVLRGPGPTGTAASSSSSSLCLSAIDDYPEFLSSPDRETNQHIRITYSTALKKEGEKSRGIRKFPFHHAKANNKEVKEENNGPVFWRCKDPRRLKESSLRCPLDSSTPPQDLTLSPPEDLKELSPCGCSQGSCQSPPAASRAVGQPSCTASTREPQGLPAHSRSLGGLPFQCSGNRNEFSSRSALLASPSLEKKESELHLYIISTTSSMFLHLKSSWNNYLIKATLLQDPVYARAFRPAGRQKPYRSEEKIRHFSQLKSELFLKDNTLGKILGLITELKGAAQKNFILKRLFWKTSDFFHFLVSKLHEYLPESRDKNALQNQSQRADELAACIEIIQTLGLMFREAETESSRLSTLTAKRGALFTLLVILISKPQVPRPCSVTDTQAVADSTLAETSLDEELQRLILEYTDTATTLLYEILLVFQQGNLGLGATEFAVGWVMSFLQSFPPTVSFVARVVARMTRGLSGPRLPLNPCQAVLLYQQLYALRSCLQHGGALAASIRDNHREEFRYFIHGAALGERLPRSYPIARPTTQLLLEVVRLMEQRPRGRR
ncbi:uncharacterized protein C12orf56 homolog [Carlito syrichta]|uniref:Uncharacterized protein C12orf56 homolog n=1 Tax=Carlito syrichta TaxID=1868482 RepID=A0A1U7TL48_CARSF|nr:uncharacterized protein C12orf56 homolog [Carlito syrichta]